MDKPVQAEHWDGPRYVGQFSPVINNVRKAYVDYLPWHKHHPKPSSSLLSYFASSCFIYQRHLYVHYTEAREFSNEIS